MDTGDNLVLFARGGIERRPVAPGRARRKLAAWSAGKMFEGVLNGWIPWHHFVMVFYIFARLHEDEYAIADGCSLPWCIEELGRMPYHDT